MDRFDQSFNESEKIGNGVYWFNYRGTNSINSSAYEVTFPPGFYIFELWGASGGGLYGGLGGYSIGKIRLDHSTKLFLYVGGQGQKYNETGNHCLIGGWNGGGLACSYRYQCSGGGGTDIRLNNNDQYLNRIIIAGGGGGAADSRQTPVSTYLGGCGGGIIGGPAYGGSGASSIPYGELFSLGGSQLGPGESVIQTNVYTNSWGSIGVGGSCAGGVSYCGSGGGGLYGGGGGYDVTGGGGGSGFISSLFSEAILYNGNQSFPGKQGNETGHLGNGCIRISVLHVPLCSEYLHNFQLIFRNILAIHVITMFVK